MVELGSQVEAVSDWEEYKRASLIVRVLGISEVACDCCRSEEKGESGNAVTGVWSVLCRYYHCISRSTSTLPTYTFSLSDHSDGSLGTAPLFKMRLIKQNIERKTGAGSATLLPEEPEDMVSEFVSTE